MTIIAEEASIKKIIVRKYFILYYNHHGIPSQEEDNHTDKICYTNICELFHYIVFPLENLTSITLPSSTMIFRSSQTIVSEFVQAINDPSPIVTGKTSQSNPALVIVEMTNNVTLNNSTIIFNYTTFKGLCP